jgi:hypothetical protein
MMVQGRLIHNWDSQVLLSEASYNTNFNPSHTPDTTGSDSDLMDYYPGLITGLIYATGDVEIENRTTFNGVILAGGKGKLEMMSTMTYDSRYYNNAPPGFTSGTDMRIVPGTWKQVSY